VLVAALIRQESNFNPRATSPVGARGLMQLMPDVGQGLASAKGISSWNADMLYDPAVNIKLGTAHLRTLMRKYPEVVKSLAAYNAGESRVEKWSTKTGAADPEVFTERIPFVETRDYVRIILRNRAYYSALYPW
jgi:soluble lytic murein transglycosylase